MSPLAFFLVGPSRSRHPLTRARLTWVPLCRKTIQTISLLAYLACEKGMWGPHLIVVPTSVILNWEMEFKKVGPADSSHEPLALGSAAC